MKDVTKGQVNYFATYLAYLKLNYTLLSNLDSIAGCTNRNVATNHISKGV